MATDQRHDFFLPVPAVRLHPTVMQALGFPEFTLATVSLPDSGRTHGAWLVSRGGEWERCPTPWHGTAQLSSAAWRELARETSPESGRDVRIGFPVHRLPVRPARVERLLAGHELGLHRDDAKALGIRKWAFVNSCGVPGAFRVRRSKDERDRGIARLSYQGRMLLGVPERRPGLLPEVFVAPLTGRRAPIGEPRLEGPGSGRWRKVFRWWGGLLEYGAKAALRAPELTLRTIDAKPGEDQALVVRLPAELFPLLGTMPGQQVYVSWGRRCKAVATALAEEPDSASGDGGRWAQTDRVGSSAGTSKPVPQFAKVRVGAETRAALGIPRTAVVTVRRRATSVILGKLNELIVPVAALFIALVVDVKLETWKLLLAASVICILLLAPSRLRRNPRGRVR